MLPFRQRLGGSLVINGRRGAKFEVFLPAAVAPAAAVPENAPGVRNRDTGTAAGTDAAG